MIISPVYFICLFLHKLFKSIFKLTRFSLLLQIAQITNKKPAIFCVDGFTAPYQICVQQRQ